MGMAGANGGAASTFGISISFSIGKTAGFAAGLAVDVTGISEALTSNVLVVGG
jgi:hypothetical protein